MALFLGIDPGKQGAIALYDPVRDWLQVDRLPLAATGPAGRAELDEEEFRRRIEDIGPYLSHAVVEKTIAMPSMRTARGDRVSMPARAALSAGMMAGQIRMALLIYRVPRTFVDPREWKTALRVPKDDDGIKARAAQLLPNHVAKWFGPKGGFLDGNAEASLMALYGARQFATA